MQIVIALIHRLSLPTLLAAGFLLAQLAAGASHASGPVIGWSTFGSGLDPVPASVNGTSGIASAIAAGDSHRCAIQDGTGNVVCWGEDAYGQATAPASVNGTSGTASAIAAGDFYNCAIQAGTGNAVCWGRDLYGETTPPSSVNGTSGTASAISAGVNHSCAVQAGTGNAVCWGRDNHGQSTAPASVNGTNGTASAIAAGGIWHSCAVQAGTGKAVCWGRDAYGQSTPPASVDGTSGTTTTIVAGRYHSCGIQTATGNAVCWGKWEGATVPARVDGTCGTASVISAISEHSCAIQAETGNAVCWGDNASPPGSVNGSSGTASEISAGLRVNLAIRSGSGGNGVPGAPAGLCAPPVVGGTGGPVPEAVQFQVNTYTASTQGSPSVSLAPNGDFVMVWSSSGSSGTDTDGSSIQGQRYTSDGTLQGAEFQVNAYTTSYQFGASVSSSSSGDFVVVWTSDGSSGTDTDSNSVQGQRYASDGSLQGGQFQVNTATAYYQWIASVSSASNGNFVVVWQNGYYSGNIQGQRYASDGSPLDGEFQVNTYTTGVTWGASVSSASDGDFVVVWDNGCAYCGNDTFFYRILGQRYASDGSPQSGEFLVSTYTMGDAWGASVSSASNGDFVVSWTSEGSFGTDSNSSQYYGSGYSVQAQRYASDGSPAGSQFQVNTYTSENQSGASVSSTPNGDFMVVWESKGSSGTDNFYSYSVQGQRYASDGSLQGAEFQVNTYTTEHQAVPSVSLAANGDFVVAWQSGYSYYGPGSYGSDADDLSIQAQRYIPEPSSAVQWVSGLLGLFILNLRRRHRR
jgi:hypothetical protein